MGAVLPSFTSSLGLSLVSFRLIQSSCFSFQSDKRKVPGSQELEISPSLPVSLSLSLPVSLSLSLPVSLPLSACLAPFIPPSACLCLPFSQSLSVCLSLSLSPTLMSFIKCTSSTVLGILGYPDAFSKEETGGGEMRKLKREDMYQKQKDAHQRAGTVATYPNTQLSHETHVQQAPCGAV